MNRKLLKLKKLYLSVKEHAMSPIQNNASPFLHNKISKNKK